MAVNTYLKFLLYKILYCNNGIIVSLTRWDGKTTINGIEWSSKSIVKIGVNTADLPPPITRLWIQYWLWWLEDWLISGFFSDFFPGIKSDSFSELFSGISLSLSSSISSLL